MIAAATNTPSAVHRAASLVAAGRCVAAAGLVVAARLFGPGFAVAGRCETLGRRDSDLDC